LALRNFTSRQRDQNLVSALREESDTACNLNDPQPPNCMQPFPNFGFQAMLSANYRYRSTTTRVVQNQTAASQGVPNVYDANLAITGLTPNSTYHCRTLTTDASGNMAAYHDQTFTTGAH